MIKKITLFLCMCFLLVSCDDPSKPTGFGYTTIQVSEQQEMQCPYCMGSGIQVSYYGPAYCSYCNGTGKKYNVSFKGKPVRSIDYRFYDGIQWSGLYSAKDGRGIVENNSSSDLNKFNFVSLKYISVMN